MPYALRSSTPDARTELLEELPVAQAQEPRHVGSDRVELCGYLLGAEQVAYQLDVLVEV